MGLTALNKITKIGIPATYWKINEVILKEIDKTCIIKLAGYMSLKAFNNGSQPIEILNFDLYTWIQDDEDSFDKLFSEETLKKELLNGRTLYDIAYDFIIEQDPDFKKEDIVSTCKNELCDKSCTSHI